MIKSMTGFGEATAEIDGVAYIVEVRTVNNRHLKTHVRLPDCVAFLGEEIEKLLRKSIYRGTVNFSVRMQNTSSQAMYSLDEEALRDYIGRLKRVANACDIKENINLAELLTLPGIIVPLTPDDDLADKMKDCIFVAAGEAIDKLKLMRAEEGKALADDLLGNCGQMRDKLKIIGDRSSDVLKVYHDKLQKRVDELLSGAQLNIDEEMLAREVAVFAERSDIAEELTRLDSHIDQFESCCNGDDNVGRRLDFISQELLREANTIASKACDSTISSLVIEIKCAIDRIKEQVQNVE